MKKKGKYIAIILVIAAIIALIAALSPRDREYDEAVVKAAAIELLTEAAKLNEIYYGNGIDFLDKSQHNISVYNEADPASLDKYGITTVDDIKQKTFAVFSSSQCNSMFKGAFMGQGTSSMSRYYQKYDDKTGNPVCIMVNSNYEQLMVGENFYDFSTLKVIGSEREFVYITIDVNVIYGEKTQKHTLTIRLLEESAGWRIASTSFASYNELKDLYDELQK